MTPGTRSTARLPRGGAPAAVARAAIVAAAVAGAGLVLAALGCASGRGAAAPGSVGALARELNRITEAGFVRGGEPDAWSPLRRATFAAVLDDALTADERPCAPDPRAVLFGGPPDGERTVRASVPHYGFFYGPVRYRVARGTDGWAQVRLVLAVDLRPTGGALEVASCPVARSLDVANAACHGAPAGVGDACPAAGAFTVPDTLENERRLLARWSAVATRLWNRDATFFGVRVRYEIVLADARELDPVSVDASVPLSSTCGRTPYFQALRSGWSAPIVAHEAGHWMGLLDEYETLSGIVRAYPKTPFPGAEKSRMGLSNDPLARVLPLHHYLVARRAFCTDAPAPEPFGRGVP